MPAMLGVVAPLALAGCGASDFPNEPRAAAPIETSASITAKVVKVSPDRFGAGPTRITIANLANDPTKFELKGRKGGAASGTIPPLAVTTIQADLAQGTYTASAAGLTGVKGAVVHVGPPRKSSQNQLLQP